MSIFDGLSRPVRAAGIGLLAVAVIAAVIGGVTLVTGGDDQEPAAQETSETNSPGSGDGGRSGSPDGQPGSGDGSDGSGDGADGNGSGDGSGDDADGNGSDGNGSDGSDGSDGSGDGSGGEDGTAGGSGGNRGGNGADGAENQKVNVKAMDVRVYNNSTISGLARTAADDMRAQGWNVVEEANYSDGVIPESTAYFRPGTDEEHAARALADSLGTNVAKRFEGIQDSSPGVIVIVTKDYADNR
ncbi:hypothetical protein GCM10009676_22090 [Prauserella halophila]|uniref:LytR/CpsA/Psr regulator C-terminal domain-containing protein n=1 Tax=Prauserella halophila TaxID=185641 RepID=A0ABN1WA76_9PSEU|nr:LytR C-terminal domain-containing protein [Prauserella halophila]MCP2235598.1 LytR cell envelope-related transcriptional attenuator [Prauserella halophila]